MRDFFKKNLNKVSAYFLPITSRIKNLPIKKQKLLGLGIVVVLVLALPIFIWAIIHQNFNPFSRAATGEPTPRPTPTPSPITCIFKDPSISISPASQAGKPGTVLNYSLTVKNNNTSPCGLTNYIATPIFPSTGWKVSIANKNLALKSGQSATQMVAVTSPTNAVGAFLFGISVGDIKKMAGSSKTFANYLVISCTTTRQKVTTCGQAQNCPGGGSLGANCGGADIFGKQKRLCTYLKSTTTCTTPTPLPIPTPVPTKTPVPTSTPTPIPAAFLKVVTPNGGESLNVGQIYDIVWNVSGRTDYVFIYTVNTLGQESLISSVLASSGRYAWKINPPNFTQNPNLYPNNYKIKIVNSLNTANFDESDNYFTVSPSTPAPTYVPTPVPTSH